MPRLGGREALEEIKSDTELRRIPVIVLTTSEEEWDVKACYDAGANAYVRKPVKLEDFAATISAMEAFWIKIVKLPDQERG